MNTSSNQTLARRRHRRMIPASPIPKWRAALLGGVLIALSLPAPTSFAVTESKASAARDSHAVCTFREPHTTVTPGISMTPGTGTITTNGETGSIICVGSIRGQQVTGPGTYGVEHPYGPGPLGPATCLQSSASGGKFFYTVPTATGPLHVEGALDYTAMGPGGTISGRSGSITFSGSFRFQPKTGDCVTTPVTAVTVEGEFVQSG